jgi:hypothetical protein
MYLLGLAELGDIPGTLAKTGGSSYTLTKPVKVNPPQPSEIGAPEIKLNFGPPVPCAMPKEMHIEDSDVSSWCDISDNTGLLQIHEAVFQQWSAILANGALSQNPPADADEPSRTMSGSSSLPSGNRILPVGLAVHPNVARNLKRY